MQPYDRMGGLHGMGGMGGMGGSGLVPLGSGLYPVGSMAPVGVAVGPAPMAPVTNPMSPAMPMMLGSMTAPMGPGPFVKPSRQSFGPPPQAAASVPGPHIPVYAPMPRNEFEDPLQEHFQLGDEAANIHGSWRMPWSRDEWMRQEWPEGCTEPEPVPEPDFQAYDQLQHRHEESTESQFLQLLESLEARVDLISQMQQTRAAIHQHTSGASMEPEGLDGLSLSGLSPTRSPARESILEDSAPQKPCELDHSYPVLPLPTKQPRVEFGDTAPPFSPSASGPNLEIADHGYRATRVRGCRQSVAVGAAPLPFQTHGRYFEIQAGVGKGN